MRRVHLFVIAAALSSVALVVGVGCSSDDRPPAASSPLEAGPPDDSGASATDSGADEDADAASITPEPDLCMNLALGGAVVEEMGYAESPIPPIGGTVMQGTYDLEEADEYGDTPDSGSDQIEALTGRTIQSTIVVTAFDLQMLTAVGTDDTDAGASTPTAQAFAYRTMGTSIIGTLVCPTTALPASMGYSASGTGLAIYPDATHRWLYAMR